MSSQPPTTWRSIFWPSIHCRRPARSPSGLETGRVGLPPAKEKARLPPSSIRRTDGKYAALLRIASSRPGGTRRSEEHTSELQSLMRISYAVFCLKKKKPIKLSSKITYPTSHSYTTNSIDDECFKNTRSSLS